DRRAERGPAHGRAGGGAGVLPRRGWSAAPARGCPRSADSRARGAARERHARQSAYGGTAMSPRPETILPSRPLAELTAGMLAVRVPLTVSAVTADSRAVSPGPLFLACRGRT